MTPALRPLIALLAAELVEGYLRDQASADGPPDPDGSERVPLPDLDRAA